MSLYLQIFILNHCCGDDDRQDDHDAHQDDDDEKGNDDCDVCKWGCVATVLRKDIGFVLQNISPLGIKNIPDVRDPIGEKNKRN